MKPLDMLRSTCSMGLDFVGLIFLVVWHLSGIEAARYGAEIWIAVISAVTGFVLIGHWVFGQRIRLSEKPILLGLPQAVSFWATALALLYLKTGGWLTVIYCIAQAAWFCTVAVVRHSQSRR